MGHNSLVEHHQLYRGPSLCKAANVFFYAKSSNQPICLEDSHISPFLPESLGRKSFEAYFVAEIKILTNSTLYPVACQCF